MVISFIGISFSDQDGINRDSLRKDIQDTLLLLESENSHPSTAVGYAGTPSKHLERTSWFYSNISTEEAEVLVNHENTFIKSLAFRKLYKKKSPLIYDLVISAYSDSNSIVYVEGGCIGFEYTLFEYYLEQIQYPYFFMTFKPSVYFNEMQKQTIDSLARTSKKEIEYEQMRIMYEDYLQKKR